MNRFFKKPAFIRTTAFRLTLLYLSLFASSAFAFLAYIYFATAGYLYHTADQAIERELTTFTEVYNIQGANGVNARVIAEVARGGRFVYDLTDPEGRRVSGMIDRLPDENQFDQQGSVRFNLMSLGPDGRVDLHAARGRRVVLPDGHRLFVAVDLGEHAHFILSILRAVWGGAVLVIALGLVGGVLFARDVERRFAVLNRVVNTARAGDLTIRAPFSTSGDEYAELGQNLNAMLERIETQTAALKSAGDALAHDLRTPLTRLKTRLEVAQTGSAENMSAAIMSAIGDTDRLLTTFNAMLALTRLESRTEPADTAEINLGDILSDVIELYIPAFEDKGIALVADFDADVIVRASPSLLAQALSNMLDNALVHAEGADMVRVIMRRGDSGLDLAVSDNGPGIAPEDRGRAHKRFVRLEKSRAKPGVGLGLSLVAAVADLHGGRFYLEDGEPNATGGVGLRVGINIPNVRM